MRTLLTGLLVSALAIPLASCATTGTGGIDTSPCAAQQLVAEPLTGTLAHGFGVSLLLLHNLAHVERQRGSRRAERSRDKARAAGGDTTGDAGSGNRQRAAYQPADVLAQVVHREVVAQLLVGADTRGVARQARCGAQAVAALVKPRANLVCSHNSPSRIKPEVG